MNVLNRLYQTWYNSTTKLTDLLSKRQTPFALSFLLFFVVWANGWMSDDAYISFRAIDNFVNGYGLVYNVAERVQAFSNPLLVLILIPFHAVFHSMNQHAMYLESMFLSLFLFFPFIFLLRKLCESNFSFAVVVFFLCLNISFIDYFTSGLENSLNYVLLLWLLLSIKEKKTTLAMHISGLLVLSRLDLFLLVAPLVLYYVYQEKTYLRYKYLIIFILPWFAWLVFSIVYYGSILPNSLIAKSAFQPSFLSVLENDIAYIFGTTVFQPMAFLMPFTLILLYIKKAKKISPLFYGALLYLALPFFGGGDFMAGRFQLLPFLILLFLVFNHINPADWQIEKNFVLLFGVLFIFHFSHYFYNKMLNAPGHRMEKSIADEKLHYFFRSSLVRYNINGELDLIYQVKPEDVFQKDTLMVTVCAGFNGFNGGSKLYLTDKIGLVDPLISRLPCQVADDWRAGHAQKKYPKGYLMSIRKAENRIKDLNVKKLYNDVILASRSKELFSSERWSAIWRLNTGYHKITRDYQ